MAMKNRLATYFSGISADIKLFNPLFKTTTGDIHES